MGSSNQLVADAFSRDGAGSLRILIAVPNHFPICPIQFGGEVLVHVPGGIEA